MACLRARGRHASHDLDQRRRGDRRPRRGRRLRRGRSLWLAIGVIVAVVAGLSRSRWRLRHRPGLRAIGASGSLARHGYGPAGRVNGAPTCLAIISVLAAVARSGGTRRPRMLRCRSPTKADAAWTRVVDQEELAGSMPSGWRCSLSRCGPILEPLGRPGGPVAARGGHWRSPWP
ncbi:hypothetical protein ACRAWD_27000 [Caulobacter segnis]